MKVPAQLMQCEHGLLSFGLYSVSFGRHLVTIQIARVSARQSSPFAVLSRFDIETRRKRHLTERATRRHAGRLIPSNVHIFRGGSICCRTRGGEIGHLAAR